MQASLLVLAGGESRRMGRPKAWLEVGDTYLVRYVAGRLAAEFTDVMVSFAEPEQLEQPVPYRIVFDRKSSAGPLAGMEAGLAAAREEVMFVLACDMPYVSLELAQAAVAAARSCDAAIPRIGGRPEPVCGAYRRTALPAIAAALDAHLLKAADLVERLDVTWLEDVDPRQLESLNTPEDLERFNAAQPSQR
ncbi:MAG TPA: molybdenum cofactor guanylyltransferase [Candidatus Dormibacteraeota bacterium]